MSNFETDVINKYVRRWKNLYSVLLVLHFLLGILAIAAPLAISAEIFQGSTVLTDPVLGFIAAICAGVLAFLKPDKYSYGFFQASSTLEVALMNYSTTGGSQEDQRNLVKAFNEARRLIGSVQPNPLSNEGGDE